MGEGRTGMGWARGKGKEKEGTEKRGGERVETLYILRVRQSPVLVPTSYHHHHSIETEPCPGAYFIPPPPLYSHLESSNTLIGNVPIIAIRTNDFNYRTVH